MVEKHDIFSSPGDQNQKVWRYIDFTKFVDLLNSKSLYFCRTDLFDDIFEGAVSRITHEHRTEQFKNTDYDPDFWQKFGQDERKKRAISCWHMNDCESAAMWKLYSTSNSGIAIQSTYSRLRESLMSTDFPVYIGVVHYVDYDKEYIPYGNLFYPYVHKRRSFEHENELRCLVNDNGNETPGNVNLTSGGVKVSVDLATLIENIYVSPESPVWFTDLVRDVTLKYGVSVQVVNSRLMETPIF